MTTSVLVNKLFDLGVSRMAKNEVFYVIHPLDDIPESKVDINELGTMEMTPAVKLSLLALRVYLIGMGLLVGYYAVTLFLQS